MVLQIALILLILLDIVSFFRSSYLTSPVLFPSVSRRFPVLFSHLVPNYKQSGGEPQRPKIHAEDRYMQKGPQRPK
jgi:hypothetical protein